MKYNCPLCSFQHGDMGHMAEAIMTKSFINPRSKKFFKEKEEVWFTFRFMQGCPYQNVHEQNINALARTEQNIKEAKMIKNDKNVKSPAVKLER